MGDHSMRSESFEGASGENDAYRQGEKNERAMIVAYLRTLADEAEKDGNTAAMDLASAAGKIERVEHPTWLNRKRGPK
jgi:hypothetical protein